MHIAGLLLGQPNGHSGLEAVHHRHLAIHKNGRIGVPCRVGQRIECLLAIAHHAQCIAQLVNLKLCHFLVDQVVFCQQDQTPTRCLVGGIGWRHQLTLRMARLDRADKRLGVVGQAVKEL